MTELSTIDLLVIDDFALESLTREESRDLYQLLVERTGRASDIVTADRDTAEWLATFDDVLLAPSAVDRFKRAAYNLVVEGDSHRGAPKPKLCENGTPPAAPVSKPEHPIKRRERSHPDVHPAAR